MKLAYWMYSGPAHIGTLRVASSFKNVVSIMHAPLGDDYFNVMKSMLERERDFTPITTSIVDRHVLSKGSQEKVINNIVRKDIEEHPDLIVITPTCTSSILQEDLQNFVVKASLESKADILLADVNHYRINELQAADRTLEQIIEFYITKAKKYKLLKEEKTDRPSVNIIGTCSLGFHNQHDLSELIKLFKDLNLDINVCIPNETNVDEIKRLPQAWINIVPYREIGIKTAEYLNREFGTPYVSIPPIGVMETANFIRKIQFILKNQNYDLSVEPYIYSQTKFISNSSWFSKSIDCQNLTGKRAIVFGDATHSACITKILTREMGIQVLWAGTYCKHDESWFRNQVEGLCDNIIITEDHQLVKDLIIKSNPSAIFGTQMEKHIGKRLGIPCGIISSPCHIQDFPLSYRPFIGYEGANQIADLIYHSFTLGMEDHLLELFGGHDIPDKNNTKVIQNSAETWSNEAWEELKQIPGFVREKVKKNTEAFAKKHKIATITPNVMYKAKESFG
jgi:light-independent protochlorophyllide reductase subunit B